MLLKWIKCGVFPEQKERFSFAQQQWQALGQFCGFLRQMGGWNANDTNEACIFSLWQDRFSYETFMKRNHDEIVAKNSQSSTYHRISVELYTNVLDGCETSSIMERLDKGKTVYVLECTESWPNLLNKEGCVSFRHMNDHRRFLIVSTMPPSVGDVTTVMLEDSWTVCQTKAASHLDNREEDR